MTFKKLITWPYRRISTAIHADRVERATVQRRKTFIQKKFNPDLVSSQVSKFVCGLNVGDYKYKYSHSCSKPTLYSSVYACMALALTGELERYSVRERAHWIKYFDGFQSESDGLFYDTVVDSDLFRNADWWGVRHLAMHISTAYTYLGGRPRFPFRFLDQYCAPNYINKWLQDVDWSTPFGTAVDLDNKIMSVGALLQYQRDEWDDCAAAKAVKCLQECLMQKRNPTTGLWGGYDPQDVMERSRMVQFAYHLLPLFFYDNLPVESPEKIIVHALATQNRLGGFGPRLNSSACEDIDSIDILVRLAHHAQPKLRSQVDYALRDSFDWVMCNQVSDGGFVFRLNEPLFYGHSEMSSMSNEGALFPTWFRMLSIAYMCRYMQIPGFKICRAPGLVY